MIAIADNRLRDSLTLLPEREEPYRLEAVYELFKDRCRSEIVLQFDGGFLQVRAEEEDDTIGFDFHSEEFERSREHRSLVSLSDAEIKVLAQVARVPALKGQNGIPANVAGAAIRPGYGKHGGLLKRRLISSRMIGRKVLYEITTSGRRALASAVWNKLIGKNCEWSWVAWSQQGYRDSIMLSFDGIVPTVLLSVCASSIEVFSIAG